jgi:hypothetical protein
LRGDMPGIDRAKRRSVNRCQNVWRPEPTQVSLGLRPGQHAVNEAVPQQMFRTACGPAAGRRRRPGGPPAGAGTLAGDSSTRVPPGPRPATAWGLGAAVAMVNPSATAEGEEPRVRHAVQCEQVCIDCKFPRSWRHDIGAA